MGMYNSIRFSLALAALSATLSSGCGSSESDLSNQAMVGMADQGVTLNGVTLNGTTLNGITLNGITLNGITLNGITLNGITLNGILLNGITFNGITYNGLTYNGLTYNGLTLKEQWFYADSSSQQISGMDLIGALIHLNIQTSSQTSADYTLRIDDIHLDPGNPTGDVYLYDISYVLDGDTTWNSLCSDGSGNPVPAIPISNSWNLQTGERIDDSNAVTLACADGALGVCVRLGYRPWAQATLCKQGNCSAVSLTDSHQACTRMLRQDYCGNGVSFNDRSGSTEVYDGFSPNINQNTQRWPLEAFWNADGAYCLGDDRYKQLSLDERLPDCGVSRIISACGEETIESAPLASAIEPPP